MKKNFTFGLVSLLLAVIFTIGAVHLTAWYDKHTLTNYSQAELKKISANLQNEINYLVKTAENLALKIERQPEWVYSPLLSPLLEDYQPKDYTIATAFTEGLNIVYAHPAKGNESIIGMNLNLRPVHFKSARQVFASGITNIEGPVTLQQTNDQGLLVHSRYLGENSLPSMVILWVDLPKLLAVSGFSSTSTSQLLIESTRQNTEPRLILGKAKDFNSAGEGQFINLPNNETWQVKLITEPNSDQLAFKLNLARLAGLSIIFLLLTYIFKSNKVFNTYKEKAGGKSFYSYLSLVIVVPAALLLVVFTYVAYTTSEKITENIMQRQVDQSTNLLTKKVEEFLLQPRLALVNLETFSKVLTNPQAEQDTQQIFLSQMRMQPNLSHISLAKPNNDYLGVSRPLAGEDVSLRINFANTASQQKLHSHWVNDNNQPSKDFILNGDSFKATSLPWYKQTKALGYLNWHLFTQEDSSLLTLEGLSAAMPLTFNNEFFGVIAAEISLTSLNRFLHKLVTPNNDDVFLMETNSNILATSSSHSNILVKEASEIIKASQRLNGNQFTYINDTKVLVDWQLLEITDGPSFILAQVIKSKDIKKAQQTMLGAIFYLFLAFIIMSTLVILAANFYITRPLLHLATWANRLGKGSWGTQPKISSNIKEIIGLKLSLTKMADELRNYAQHLETRVEERTEELKAANKRLEEISLTDPLTGIANRRRFNYLMEKEWRRSYVQHKELGLILIDLDWFKKYNDFYGHLKGDEILIEVAQQLEALVKSQISTPSLVARYGGEEFAVVIPATNKQELTDLAAKICQHIFDLNLEHQASTFGRLSLSLGVATLIAAEKTNFDGLIDIADQALYQAKELGRNRYCTPKM